MERIWKLGKVFAFILILTAFVYVGYIMSQKGRYQPITTDIDMIIDTQTGSLEYFDRQENTFHRIDFKNHTYK